jgi:hypothetical protein
VGILFSDVYKAVWSQASSSSKASETGARGMS